MGSRNPHIASCLECRVRKAKCSKERPTCAQCSQSQRECIYVPKVARTPLTRAHLTSVEQRLAKFENALHKLFPAGDVEDIVHNLVQGQDNHRTGTDCLPSDLVIPEGSSNQSLAPTTPLPTDQDENLLTASISPLPRANPSQSTLQGDQGISPPPVDAHSNIFNISSGGEDIYINAYFLNYHPAHPFVHESTFRDKYEAYETCDLAWHILIKTVIAVGAWSLGDDDDSQIDLEYYTQVKHLLQHVPLMEPGNLTLLQALVLLHEFAQKRGMPQLGLQYLATATRMAINLGFHREDSNSRLTLFDGEMRRRVWWSVYIFDSCAAKSFGLPLLLPENSFITTRSPLNINDEMLGPMTSLAPSEMDSVTLYSGLIYQAKFHVTANNVYRRLVATPDLSATEARELENTINVWRNSCPAYLKGPSSAAESSWVHFTKDRLRICDKNLRILLWRPLLLEWTLRESAQDFSIASESDLQKEAAFRCLYVAKESMALVLESIEQNQHTRLGASFLLYCLFHVMLVFVVFVKSGALLPDSACFLNDIRTIKRVISHSWLGVDAQATYFLHIIDRLCASLEGSSE